MKKKHTLTNTSTDVLRTAQSSYNNTAFGCDPTSLCNRKFISFYLVLAIHLQSQKKCMHCHWLTCCCSFECLDLFFFLFIHVVNVMELDLCLNAMYCIPFISMPTTHHHFIGSPVSLMHKTNFSWICLQIYE